MKRNFLVTGSSGFIGFHLCNRLLKEGNKVLGIDNMNSYYDVDLKTARLNMLLKSYEDSNFIFHQVDLINKKILEKLFSDFKPDIVINLAAQAGVRYSINNPDKYIDSNIVGFMNVLECCKLFPIEKLIYASSSSVYGGNKKVPFSEEDPVDHPVNLYAATKKSNELMAHSYSHLFSIPCIGLRFFTVYGPWGRPDMAPMLFTKAILANQPIKVFNYGNMFRDFTYIDDVIEFLMRIIPKKPFQNTSFNMYNPNPSSSFTCHEIFNLGNSKPISLKEFIDVLERKLAIKCEREFVPMQKGEVEKTFANIDKIIKFTKYKPKIEIQEGIENFVKWYREFYN